MPRYLSAGAVAVAVWVAAASGEAWTGTAPAGAVALATVGDYALWARKGRPWHDWATILLLLPAIFGAVWIAVGGLVLGVQRSDADRLLLEVGPGVVLTGLLCTLVSYHGRHHPGE